MFKKYLEYLKDNPKKQWFKAKLYGWGWTPVTWQGWLIIAIYVGFIILIATNLDSRGEPTTKELIYFFIKIAVVVVTLIAICYKTGEKPKWQWGLPKNNDKDKGK